jgi:hypothetical protein
VRRLSGWLGTLAVAIVAMAIGAAIGGAATGARMAAEAAPSPVAQAETAPPEERPVPPRPQAHSVLGVVVRKGPNGIAVRTPEGPIVRVRVLPNTIIRRAGERADLAAIEPGDRVVAVGRVNPNGVLLARGLRVQPSPPPEGALPLRLPAGAAPLPKPARPPDTAPEPFPP